MHTILDDQVRERLAADRRIPDPARIAVSADQGSATLRGAVATFGQRLAAAEDARKVEGVDQVFFDELKVHLLAGHHREDEQIRGVALQALIWDSEVDAESLDVRVKDGWVTLTGDATYQFQSAAGYPDVARLRGVVGVTNEITVLGIGRTRSGRVL
jgi:osmotically-inducible protein OsmY